MAVAALKHFSLKAANRSRNVLYGLMAVAALKRRGGIPGVTVGFGSPRPHGRGRIEARPSTSNSNGSRMVLHGLMAVAALKPCHKSQGSEWPVVLHGLMAVAALKRIQRVLLQREQSCSPRPHGRGRIEASEGRRASRCRCPFSTASWPWPH